MGGWRWSISLISSFLLPSLTAGQGTGTVKGGGEVAGGGVRVEAFVAGLTALQRIVSYLSLLAGGRAGQDEEMDLAGEGERRGGGEGEAKVATAERMLTELRGAMERPLAHVFERVHELCGAAVKDKKNAGCPPKLLLPLRALYGCIAVFPVLQPAWPLPQSIQLLAALTQHSSESVRQQAELALVRLLLTSCPLVLHYLVRERVKEGGCECMCAHTRAREFDCAIACHADHSHETN